MGRSFGEVIQLRRQLGLILEEARLLYVAKHTFAMFNVISIDLCIVEA